MSEWQPIETAPKDGTWIMVHYNPNCVPLITFWNNVADIHDWAHREDLGKNSPTHWMPLPGSPC